MRQAAGCFRVYLRPERYRIEHASGLRKPKDFYPFIFFIPLYIEWHWKKASRFISE